MGWIQRAWRRIVVAVVLGAAVWGGVVPAAEAQGKGAKGGTTAHAAELKEARRLNDEAEALYQTGKYEAAVPLAQRALAIREKLLGPDHPDVAESLNSLAGPYKAKGEYGLAEPLYRRALAIREKALGPDHLDVSTSLNNLAGLHLAKGEYGLAEPLLQRALAIREKLLGPDHLAVAMSANNLASLYDSQGDYGRAEPLFQRALAIFERTLGPDHPAVATSLNNLAWLYEEKGEYGLAEPLYRRALAIREKLLGPDHPDVAVSLNNLANLCSLQAEYARAEPLFARALAILETALGPDHPTVATSLNNLALLYDRKGEYARAEPLYQRSLAIREKALGPLHPDVAASLNNLADLIRRRGDYDRAEPLFARALAIGEKALGLEHPTVASCLNNLALLHLSKGEHERAEALFQRSLAIREKTLGEGHADVGQSLANLALLYQMKGEYGRAEAFHQRAAAILAKKLAPDHPEVITSLHNLSLLRWASGRLPEAVAALTGAQDLREKVLTRLIAGGSEAQKLAFLRPVLGESDAATSLALNTRDPRAARLGLLTVLRRKGRALDAMADSYRALRARLGPEEQKLFDELQAARSRYVTLSLSSPGRIPVDADHRDRGALDEQIRQLEDAISKRSEEFRADEQPLTVDAVQAALPDGTALVEWSVYYPFNLKARNEKEKWGPPRYAASILPKHGDPVWVDLGDAATLDADVQALRDAFARPGSKDAPTRARALEAKVMAPVRALLGDTRRVFLSPDGALDLIPFDALVGDDGRPLIERYAFTYLTSGRDLLRRASRVPVREPPLVVSAPDFDKDAPAGGPFALLLHSAEVSATISARFQHPSPRVLTGGAATKAGLQKVAGPQFLHLDTHGYFGAKVCSPTPSEGLLADALLRSGIALAGANGCTTGNDAGLLTAKEASGLDLYGTRLVVLSACETGVGEAKAGDGVYGLRRALVLAGAETQVMSLWPVDSAATADLMKAYYEALAKGGGRSEAMRQVQLAMLHDGRYEHPYYWASFIVSGDDRALDGKAVMPDLPVHPGGACTCRLGEPAPEGAPLWLAGTAALALSGWRAAVRQGRRLGRDSGA